MRPSHRGPGLGGAAGARPQRGPAGCTRERAKHRPALRGSRPGTFSAPPRAVRALTLSGLLATAKFILRRAWTAGSRGGGLVRAQCPRSLHRFHPPPRTSPPPPRSLKLEPRGLAGDNSARGVPAVSAPRVAARPPEVAPCRHAAGCAVAGATYPGQGLLLVQRALGLQR